MIFWCEVEFSWLPPVLDFFVVFSKQANRRIRMGHVGDDIKNRFKIAFGFSNLRFHYIDLFTKSFAFANKLLFNGRVFFFGNEFRQLILFLLDGLYG